MKYQLGKIIYATVLLQFASPFGEILLSSNVEGPVCPGTELMYLCESNDSNAAYTIWEVQRGECNASNINRMSDRIILVRTKFLNMCTNLSGTCGRFMAKNTLSSSMAYCTSSILSFIVAVDMNETAIQCSIYGVELLSSINASIHIESIPQSPNVTLLADLDSVTVQLYFSGKVPNASSINVFNDGKLFRSLVTNKLSTLITLPSNTNYTFSISAVNCVGSSIPKLSSTCTMAAPPLSSEIQVFISGNHLNVSWKDEGRCITHYWIQIDDDDDAAIDQQVVICSNGCFYSQLIKRTSNYYSVYISSVTPSGIGPESEQIKTQPQFEVFVLDRGKNHATLECINQQPDLSAYMCYVCCSDSKSNQISNSSVNTGANTTVILTQLLDTEKYTCIAVSTDASVAPCEDGSLKSYLRYRFTIEVIQVPTQEAKQVQPMYSIIVAGLPVLLLIVITTTCIIVIKRWRKKKYHRANNSFPDMVNDDYYSVQSDTIPLTDSVDQ